MSPRPRATIDFQAVAAAFAPAGLHGTSVDAVARAAGLAKPTLYVRGGGKEELFAACVEAEVERVLGALHAAPRDAEAPPADRLAALGAAMAAHAAEHPAGTRLVLVTAHHRGSAVATRVDAALERLARGLAVLAGPDLPRTRGVEPADVAAALLAALGAVIARAAARPGADVTAVASAAARLFALGQEAADGAERPDEALPRWG